MLQIATLRNDLMGRFHNALYLGDVQERVAVLREAGQLGLAYLTATAHGLEDEANALKVPHTRGQDALGLIALYCPCPWCTSC